MTKSVTERWWSVQNTFIVIPHSLSPLLWMILCSAMVLSLQMICLAIYALGRSECLQLSTSALKTNTKLCPFHFQVAGSTGQSRNGPEILWSADHNSIERHTSRLYLASGSPHHRPSSFTLLPISHNARHRTASQSHLAPWAPDSTISASPPDIAFAVRPNFDRWWLGERAKATALRCPVVPCYLLDSLGMSSC